MKYSDLDLKVKRGTMECCKKDCKEKECFRGWYCIDLDIANDFAIRKAILEKE